MDTESEIEYSSSLGQLKQIAFRSKHKYFIFIKLQLELIHDFQVTTSMFQGLADGRQPFIQTTFTLYTFVTPMGRKTTFGNIIHTFGTNLYFHPFAFRSHNGRVKRFIAITLRNTEPIPQTLRIRHIHIRYNGVDLPTFLLFLLKLRIKDNSDSKQIVYPFERTFLLLHLLIDGVNGFGSSFHVELQSGLFQLLLNRFDECSNVSVSGSLCFVQLFLDVVVNLLFSIFQRKVFQFGFQFVKPQLMGEGSI